MISVTRRKFVKDAAIGVTSATLLASSYARAAGANERVRVAVVGCGRQGSQHLRALGSLPDVQIAALSDVDQHHLAAAAKAAPDAKKEADFRRILDDPSIDAVTIATPDHWHAPVALLALDAGKHVYVEKPCCHNIREGQLLLDAAKKSGKSVAHGTQSRSNPAIQEAMAMLRSGVIGNVLQARCWNWQLRENIGHMRPSAPPSHVDYDTWVGPAEMVPFQANRFHYDWHWWYNFGCGDLGNDGIHEFDYALWGLGAVGLPTLISGIGGKYFFDDDQEFPDTQQISYEFPGDEKAGDRKMLIYEMRLWSNNYPYNVDSGAEFYGDKGKMFISKRGKFDLRGSRNEVLNNKLADVPKAEIAPNQRNWIDCIKSGQQPNANMEVAVRTAIAVHLGNIATRLGRTIHFDPATETIVGDDEAQALISRKYRAGGHWSVPKGV